MDSEITPTIKEQSIDDPDKPPAQILTCDINVNRLILKYKTIIKETGVEYSNLLNYTFSIVERKLYELLRLYKNSDKDLRAKKKLFSVILAMLEFCFFTYSASPKVNHTIRICRIISTSVTFIKSNNLPYEQIHRLFKFIYDNTMHQLEKNTMSVNLEVESLYLLIAISQIGEEYLIPEATLLKHFHIEEDFDTGTFKRTYGFLNHFSITVLLSYIQDEERYRKLREFIEDHTVEKLKYKKAYCHIDSEALMLFLDLIVCPYVSKSTKLSLGNIFGLASAELSKLEGVNDHWFTTWGDKFDLGKELDAKRFREVY